MERQNVATARIFAETLMHDAEAVLGLLNSLRDAETRLEYHLVRRLVDKHCQGARDAARNVVHNLPKPATVLPKAIIADWEERYDEAWDERRRLDLVDVVLEVHAAGAEARDRFARHMAERGVDLQALEEELGIEWQDGPMTEGGDGE